MSAKDSPLPLSTGNNIQKELDSLYARRTALDTLIKNLERYDRVLAKNENGRKRETA